MTFRSIAKKMPLDEGDETTMQNLRKPCRVRGCRNTHHKDFPMCSTHMAELPPDQRAAYWMDPTPELAAELIKQVSGVAPEKRRSPSDETTHRKTHMQQRVEELREVSRLLGDSEGDDDHDYTCTDPGCTLKGCTGG